MKKGLKKRTSEQREVKKKPIIVRASKEKKKVIIPLHIIIYFKSFVLIYSCRGNEENIQNKKSVVMFLYLRTSICLSILVRNLYTILMF